MTTLPRTPTTAAGRRFCEGPRPTGNWWKGVPDQIADIEAEAAQGAYDDGVLDGYMKGQAVSEARLTLMERERDEAQMEYADCWQEGDRLLARLTLAEAVVDAAQDHGICSCAAMTNGEGPRPIGGGRFYHYQGCDDDVPLRSALDAIGGKK